MIEDSNEPQTFNVYRYFVGVAKFSGLEAASPKDAVDQVADNRVTHTRIEGAEWIEDTEDSECFHVYPVTEDGTPDVRGDCWMDQKGRPWMNPDMLRHLLKKHAADLPLELLTELQKGWGADFGAEPIVDQEPD